MGEKNCLKGNLSAQRAKIIPPGFAGCRFVYGGRIESAGVKRAAEFFSFALGEKGFLCAFRTPSVINVGEVGRNTGFQKSIEKSFGIRSPGITEKKG